MVADSTDDLGSMKLESLGWEELVNLKRKLSAELKQLSATLIEIDNNRSQTLYSGIRDVRAQIEQVSENTRRSREEIEKSNASLLEISEKISQAKNFLSMIHSRLPSESVDQLVEQAESIRAELEMKKYSTEREKDELLSKSKDVTMKLEAIRAANTVNDQLAGLSKSATDLRESINGLNVSRKSDYEKLAILNGELDGLYDSKRKISAERDSAVSQYASVLKQFEAVNSRLDAMSEMRKRQREEYGYALPNDALFKVKEGARKKLESGSKLSFEELKLLYEDKKD